uniref:RHOMBOID-like protein n=1 Tax=Davidia involucrata TaxID=16924 RepID=A0A5B6ZSS2_DAVIN
MGRDGDHSPELEIKVHPRRGEHHNHNHSTRPVAPQSHRQRYQPFKRWFPWLVPTYVVINIVVFAVAMYINDCPRHSTTCFGQDVLGRFAFQTLRENPLLGPSASTLQLLGALEVKKMVEKHQVWRLFTCTWLHAGVFHVLANMLGLIFVGIQLEKEFGFVRIGLLYIISGIGGSLLSGLFVQTTISVGASGALFGLLGAMLSELLTNWTIYDNKLAALLTLILIIAINLAIGILPHVDNFAHIGGFLTGFFLGFVLLIRPQFGWISQRNASRGHIGTSVKSKYKTYQYVLFVFSLVILIVGFALGLVLLLQGVNGNEHCPWCHYLSCIPTSKWKCQSQKVICESDLIGNELNLTCQSNHKSKFYILSSDNNTSSKMMELCSQLCS